MAAAPIGSIQCIPRAVPGGRGRGGAERAGKQCRPRRIIVRVFGRDDLVGCLVLLASRALMTSWADGVSGRYMIEALIAGETNPVRPMSAAMPLAA
jgi:hypothetical protein